MNPSSWRYVAGVAAVLGVGGGILYAAHARNPEETQTVAAAGQRTQVSAPQGPAAPTQASPSQAPPQAAGPAGGSSGGQGAAGTGGEARPRGPAAALDQLSLTPQQQKDRQAIQEKLRAEQDRIRASKATPQQQQDQLQAARRQAWDEMSRLLTPEQRERMRGAMGGPGGGQGPGGRGRGSWMQQAFEKMDLKPEQRQQLEAARHDLTAAREKASAGDPRSDAAREALREAGRQYRDRVSKILTPEQQKQLEAARPRLEGPGFGRPGGGPGFGPPGAGGPGAGRFGERLRRATAELQLSPDQKQRIDAVIASHEKEIEQLRSHAPQGSDPSRFREQMAPLREKLRQEVDQVLTADQRQKLKEQMQPGPGSGGR